MERKNVKYKSEIVNNQSIIADTGDRSVSMDENQNNPVFENLLAEGGENFFHYINWLGLAKESEYDDFIIDTSLLL